MNAITVTDHQSLVTDTAYRLQLSVALNSIREICLYPPRSERSGVPGKILRRS